MPQVGSFFLGLTAAGTTGASIGAYMAGVSVAGFASSIAGRLLLTVAASALQMALRKKPRAPGLKTSVTQNGGTNPQSFILGRYATAGAMVCPPMSHGSAGKTPNAYLNYVIDYGDIPGQQLDALILNDEEVAIGDGTHPAYSADYGFPILGDYEGYAWVRYYDGSQTAADPMLLAKYPAPAERPWTADMVGTGLCYAVFTFRYSREIFNNLPVVRAVLQGIPLYDPRADTSVGGSGTQRWNDPSTWAPSENPIVQAYNIKRGITLPDGSVWGGGIPAEDLPLDNWMAGMNACDLSVLGEDGNDEPQFRTGIEVYVSDEPAEVLEEIYKGASTQVSEVGGEWKVRVGGPGLPVFFLSDEDIIVSEPRDYDPFPGLASSYNGITASYPEPATLWENRDAPPRYNATWEAEDGGRRLVADLQLPAVPYSGQVQRVMQAYISDERRARRHSLTLPPEAAVLEPLDTISWTSERNGYAAKVFDVSEVADDLRTGRQGLSVRECDPTDFDPAVFYLGYELPSAVAVRPPLQSVPLWNVTKAEILDSVSTPRRPALRMSWDGEAADDAAGLRWEIRLAGTTTVILRGTTQDVSAGELIVSDGILAATAYEVRGELLVDRATDWSGWVSVTTDDIRLGSGDLAPEALLASYRSMSALAPRVAWRTTVYYATHEPDTQIFLNGSLKVDAPTKTTGTLTVALGDVLTVSKPTALLHDRDNLLSTLARGRLFYDRWTRYDGLTYGIYAMDEDATITITVEGETPVQQAVAARSYVEVVAGVTYPSAQKGVTITSDKDVLLCRDTDPADAYMLWPASKEVIGKGGSGALLGTVVTSAAIGSALYYGEFDATGGGIFAVADGAGGDGEYGVPVDACGTHYVLTHDIEDFILAAVEPCTIYHYDNTGALISTYDLSSASRSAPAAAKVGSVSGLDGVTITGGAAGCYFVGTAPFFMRTNTKAGDFEYSLLGWRESLRNSFNSTSKVNAGQVMLNGGASLADWQGSDKVTINGGAVEAGSMSAFAIGADYITSNYLSITTAMSIDAANAGFRMGKTNAYDLDNDGIYMGRTVAEDQSVGFGFLMGRKTATSLEYMQATKDGGLKVVNAQFYRELDAPSLEQTITTTQTVNLATTTKLLDLTILGGGQGGRDFYGVWGGAGGNTVVKLLDGTTVIQTWTSNGGTTGGPSDVGEDSILGTGGTRGYSQLYKEDGDWRTRYIAGGDATGYGAGGGGWDTGDGAGGGAAAQGIAIVDFDLEALALTDPKLEITVGAAGLGIDNYIRSNNDKSSGSGSPGVVKYTEMDFGLKPADVVPLAPTAVGTMQSVGPFPDLGPGMWVIATQGTTQDVGLDTFEVDDIGTTLRIVYGAVATFVAAKTPVVISNAYGTRTLNYYFYKMGAA